MKSDSEKFADVLMEGIRITGTPRYDDTTRNLAILLHESRQQVKKLKSRISEIDEVFADASVSVKCRSCESYYELPCDISEFNPDYSYCGGSPRCVP